MDIVTHADKSRFAASDRRDWLIILARSYSQIGKPGDALKAFKVAFSVPDGSRDQQAQLRYEMAMCYKEMGLTRSAYTVMEAVSKLYADTSWGQQARRTANGWRVVEELQKQKAEGGGQ